MRINSWTLGLAATGVISLGSTALAEEKSNPIMTALSSTSISGYVDTAAVWRWGNNTSQTGGGSGWLAPGTVNGNPYATPGGIAPNQKADLFSLNAVVLTLEKPLDEAEWAAGYRVDMLFGPDANNWNNSVNAGGLGGAHDMALRQAYVALRAPAGNGLEFKLGVWDCPHGFEGYDSYKNPHWTRSYGWEIEPTQHTGVLANYRVNEIVSVNAGIANTAAAGINTLPTRAGAGVSETEKTYLGGITLTAPESFGFAAGSTLSAEIVNGLAGGASDTTWVYVGGTLNTPLEGLKLGASYDYRLTSSKSDPASLGWIPGTYAYAIAGYISFKATEKLNLAARVNYAKGTSDPWNGLTTWYNVGFGETDPKNQLLGVTGTIDYSLWENVITRLEFRWDHDLTGQHLNSAGANAPALGGPFGFDDRNNFLMALNVIYKF